MRNRMRELKDQETDVSPIPISPVCFAQAIQLAEGKHKVPNEGAILPVLTFDAATADHDRRELENCFKKKS